MIIKLFFYYLALFVCILEIIMFVSIIFIPLVMILRDDFDWWEKPFVKAYIEAN